MSLITEDYRAQNAALHRSRPDYGTTAIGYALFINKAVRAMGLETVLDYGAGKGMLKSEARELKLDLDIQEYDPAIESISEVPTEPADLLVCIDVLEHIEPDCLESVLAHMESLTGQAAFVTVCCRKAKKTLADGRNAHLIVKPQAWWLRKLLRYWDVQYFQSREKRENGFEALLRKRC